MLKNDSTSANSNTTKCAFVGKTVLGKHREKSLNPPPTKSQCLFNLLKSGKDSSSSDSNSINSGSSVPVKRLYKVERVEVEKPICTKKVIYEKSKIVDKKHKSDSIHKKDKDKIKKTAKRSEDRITNEQKKCKGKSSNELKRSTKHEKQSNKARRINSETACNERIRNHEKHQSSDHKKSLEQRLSTRVWQILSRDLFLLDYDKFNSKIQATDSETKRYIISVVKKCNNKELKKHNPPRALQQTSSSDIINRKKAIKRRVRRQLWYWTKNTIKHNAHWRQFLAENNIVLDNINIDKLDLSLIDVNALGIENKLLKRTIVWLFK